MRRKSTNQMLRAASDSSAQAVDPQGLGRGAHYRRTMRHAYGRWRA